MALTLIKESNKLKLIKGLIPYSPEIAELGDMLLFHKRGKTLAVIPMEYSFCGSFCYESWTFDGDFSDIETAIDELVENRAKEKAELIMKKYNHDSTLFELTNLIKSWDWDK